tara:strand:- start:4146 stop:4535 length:390 start_codon:yes stop_codon:yes gene_type:complete
MSENVDHELRERFARLEAQMETLQQLPSKMDSLLQLQITFSSVQEHTRGQTERLTSIVSHVEDHGKRLSGVETKLSGLKNWIAGALLVMTIIVIPSYAFLFKEQREQLMVIDRRLSTVEYEVQKARGQR